ncbi:membrane protein insertase YidC [Ruminococcaceae bacterium OttesenSCG-928-I18]|nr:membrane protein insertase YidC [Ruminococcaceae bacterium OttesenSCG-928-I18]
MIDFFGFLALPLSFIMRFIYDFVLNYGWTIIIFTVLIRIAMIPLGLMQQKSSARMSAYQPFIQEIQKKWANDRNRQNQEMQKFYQENNIKMTGGCLPMIVNMVVIFGIIAIIQAPLKYMVGLPAAEIDSARYIVAANTEGMEYDDNSLNYTIQSTVIGEIKSNPQMFIDGVENEEGEIVKMGPEYVQKVEDFNFEFLGMNLAQRPSMAFNRYLIMPILSVLTMFASQIILMKTGGTAQMPGQGKNTMLIMTFVMGIMFGFFAFTVPVGFSLYYTASNIVLTGQQLLLKKIYNPAKMREEIAKEIEHKKQMKKAKKVVKVKDKKGFVIEKQMSDAEIARLRLEKARQMDQEKYAAEEEKSEIKSKKKEQNEETSQAQQEEETNTATREETSEESNAQQNGIEKKDKTEEYKPGRRKRARMKKTEVESESKEPMSFAEKEMEAEKNAKSPEEDA